MTLIEFVIAAALSTVVMLGALAFIQAINHAGANDVERNISLVEQTGALARMTHDLGQTYELRSPAKEEETNVADVKLWVGSPQKSRRVVYNCGAAGPASGQQECIRYEMPGSDETGVAELSHDNKATSQIVIPRLVNGTHTAFVFSFKKDAREKETGKSRPSFVAIEIKTPGQGERATYANQSGYTYNTTLRDSVYMRNLDLAE